MLIGFKTLTDRTFPQLWLLKLSEIWGVCRSTVVWDKKRMFGWVDQLPDRPFYNFEVSKSVAQRS